MGNGLPSDPADPDAEKYREVYYDNPRFLADHGVRVVIGTDMRGSVPEELLYPSSLGVLAPPPRNT
jgi:hypothetical protein